MTANDWSFETKQIHAGYNIDPATGATALPIYQTSSYAFKDTAQAASRFALQELGPIYTRLTNPTTDGVAARIAALEGGVGGLLVSSGQSATALSILALAVAGNNVVASPSLYGGSVTLLKNTLGRLGIEARFVPNPLDPEAWRALADDKTVAFYGETIPNPQGDILDIEPIAKVAHEVGVPLIVDNTVATPLPGPPDRVGRRHRRSLGHQVPGRSRNLDRGRDRRLGQLRLRLPARAFPPLQHAGRVLPRPRLRP